MVRADERSNLLRELVRDGLGTKDVENFITKQRIQKSKKDKEESGKDKKGKKGKGADEGPQMLPMDNSLRLVADIYSKKVRASAGGRRAPPSPRP